MHEETIRGTVTEVHDALPHPTKGEITIVVEGGSGSVPIEDIDLERLVSEWRDEGLTTKEMAQRLQQQFGWRRKTAYQAILEATETEND